MEGSSREGTTVVTAVPTLRTERLLLRPFEPSDAARVRALAGAPEVAATTGNIPHPYPEGSAEAWISTHADRAAAGAAFVWAVTLAEDGELLGAISILPVLQHGRAEIGYWLGVPYWNRGYMTEATRRVVAWGFSELGLNRIEIRCFPRNVGSSRVAEKVGLEYEGTLRGYARKGDRYEDLAVYGLLRGDPADGARD